MGGFEDFINGAVSDCVNATPVLSACKDCGWLTAGDYCDDCSLCITAEVGDGVPNEGDPCTNCHGFCCGQCDADTECDKCWCVECEGHVETAHEGSACCPVAGPADDESLNEPSCTAARLRR